MIEHRGGCISLGIASARISALCAGKLSMIMVGIIYTTSKSDDDEGLAFGQFLDSLVGGMTGLPVSQEHFFCA